MLAVFRYDLPSKARSLISKVKFTFVLQIVQDSFKGESEEDWRKFFKLLYSGYLTSDMWD